MDKVNDGAKLHSVLIRGRETLEISGISDVLSFDEDSVVMLATHDMGIISVEGEGLKIRSMDSKNGDILVEGRINGLVYIDKSSGGRAARTGLFGRRK